MGFVLGLLTLIMVLDCIVLVFLVLIQLPKKEAGAGLAFGGAATDALFGAGSGNVLTKVTKYAATIFFIMAVFLSVLQSKYSRRSGSGFQKQISQPVGPRPSAGTLPPAPAATPTATPTQPTVPLTTGAVTVPIVEQPTATTATPPAVPATTNAAPAPPPSPAPAPK